MKIAFLDRDGTMIWEPPDTKQIDSLERLRILPGVIDGLKNLQRQGFTLVMVSNQNGVGTPSFPTEDFEKPQQEFLRILAEAGITFTNVFVCPHLPEDDCACRKPKTGLVDDFLSTKDIDLSASVMVGDRETDRLFAENIGVRFVGMETNGRFPRFASVSRKTKETAVSVFVNLDGNGSSRVTTGIGFLDHMLDLLAKHSLIDLDITTKGDLQVDEHHTVEDTALALGSAMATALGDKRGIERYGFVLPMDEALAEVAIDLSGRPYFVFDGKFEREFVGELPTELIPHFFESLAQSLKCNLHMTIKRGSNEHHKIEALFKGLGRSLRQAFRQSPFEKDIPSTKGSL
ncbi:MAG: bifunctional histidinol-phosphatase/imidazoleglycerol-phosphate dehydratase HisB [Candidatus Peribacteraceae bacterium]|nr:bifunctional histidinol-phosphatase/imidazoleglycerol-phosphate dehydratase HisB [Candidatus Peribacteraceae bacterium]